MNKSHSITVEPAYKDHPGKMENWSFFTGGLYSEGQFSDHFIISMPI